MHCLVRLACSDSGVQTVGQRDPATESEPRRLPVHDAQMSPPNW